MTTTRIDFRLDALDSPQEKAGLAGLVIAERYSRILPPWRFAYVLKVENLTDDGCTLEVDHEGMKRLQDLLYEPIMMLPPRPPEPQGEKPPADEAEAEGNGKAFKPKNGKKAKKKPKKEAKPPEPRLFPGAPVIDWLDPTATADLCLWTILYRAATMATIWKRSKQRTAFTQRLEAAPIREAYCSEQAMLARAMLSEQKRHQTVELSSTLFWGSGRTADGKHNRLKTEAYKAFLLQFRSLVTGYYVTEQLSDPRENKWNFGGFSMVFPDICRLKTFVEAYIAGARRRGTERRYVYPADAFVVSAEQAAFEYLRMLGPDAGVWAVEAHDLVCGENEPLQRGFARVEPWALPAYEDARSMRLGRLLHGLATTNAASGKPLEEGYGGLCASANSNMTIESNDFLWGTRRLFKMDGQSGQDEQGEKNIETPADLPAQEDLEEEVGEKTNGGVRPEPLARMMREFVGHQVWRFLDHQVSLTTKFGWAESKNDPKRRKEYQEARERLVKQQFHVIRNHSANQFRRWISKVLFSCNHSLTLDEVNDFWSYYDSDWSKLHTAVIIALQARRPPFKSTWHKEQEVKT